jgi:hypothetical protein
VVQDEGKTAGKEGKEESTEAKAEGKEGKQAVTAGVGEPVTIGAVGGLASSETDLENSALPPKIV